MGVINDYFRAADAECAVLAIASGPLSAGFDTVEAKGIDPAVVLGQLVAFIRGTPWSPDTVAMRPVWPPPKTEPTSKDAYDRPPESSPWRTGPWLHELNLETVTSWHSWMMPGYPSSPPYPWLAITIE